jgi:hypothetical protein
MFVGKLENSEIKEIAYIEDFFTGEFIDIQFSRGKFYLLDSSMNIKVVKLPLISS